jgi:CHAD domain-containing protein
VAEESGETDLSFREAMRGLIGERWEAVWKAVPAAIEGADIEGVHDVRVASRRLRAAMDISQDAFPASWYRPLHRAAKEITSELGEVRDRDVQIEYFESLLDTASTADKVGIQRMIKRLETERDKARAEMVNYLESLENTGLISETRKRFSPQMKCGQDIDQ